MAKKTSSIKTAVDGLSPEIFFDSRRKTRLRRSLLDWFDKNKRTLPWRSNSTPYRVWVSEIMLQQTQVATVIDYYRRFMIRFPNVKRLAEANEEEVLKLWEGLGYYRRARQLHAAAKQIVVEHRGRFPKDFDSVLALPGIGRYTAGAILSIALDQRHPILEGNTQRLFARLTGLEADVCSTDSQKQLWKFSETLLPRNKTGDFNQALMELGSLVCTPTYPGCGSCPLRNVCISRIENKVERIPLKNSKIKYEALHESVVLIETSNRFLVRRCADGERWAGLYDFPRFDITKAEENPIEFLTNQIIKDYGIEIELESTKIKIKHAVTKYRIELTCYRNKSKIAERDRALPKHVKWVHRNRLRDLAFNVTARKIADRISEI